MKNGNKPTPTLQQIRRKFHNTATIDDYIQCFSEGYLIELHERDDSLPANYLNCAGYTSKQRLTSTDKATLSIINVYQGKMRWPVQRCRYQTFHEDKGLNHLRMYKSNSVKHVPEIINDGTKEGRHKCTLCSKNTVKRNTRYECCICKIPLCTTILKGQIDNATSCFLRWHLCIDLCRSVDRSSQLFNELYNGTSSYLRRSVDRTTQQLNELFNSTSSLKAIVDSKEVIVHIIKPNEKEGKSKKDNISRILFDSNSDSESSVDDEDINVVVGRQRKCNTERASVVPLVEVSSIQKRVIIPSISLSRKYLNSEGGSSAYCV